MCDRSVDDAFDTCIGKNRNPFRSKQQAGFQAFNRLRQQFHVETPVYPVNTPGNRARGFVGSNQNALLFLSDIAGRNRITHHRGFFFKRFNLWQVLGNDVLVFHVYNRQPESCHLGHLIGKTACRIDHVLTNNRALFGINAPLAAGGPFDTDDPVSPDNFHPLISRADCH